MIKVEIIEGEQMKANRGEKEILGMDLLSFFHVFDFSISLIRKNSQVCTNFVQTYFLRDSTVKSLYKICTDFCSRGKITYN